MYYVPKRNKLRSLENGHAPGLAHVSDVFIFHVIGYFRDTLGAYDGLLWLLGGLHSAFGAIFLVFVFLERRRRDVFVLS